jgi:SWI/SNF related-matrix-associated actin-dependent regulator of chromatin subfamily C
MLLLEGVERYQQDWDEVQRHVATKTKEQCLAHFLRLPIEDPYLEDQISLAARRRDPIQIIASEEGLPFEESATNPIPTLVAWLASVASPEAVAAATRAAKEQLEKAAPAGSGDAPQAMDAVAEPTELDIQAIASAGLAIASLKATELVEEEDKELQRLVMRAVELELLKVDTKLRQLAAFEKFLEDEWAHLERNRKQLLADRIAFESARLDATESTGPQPIESDDQSQSQPAAAIPPQ